MQRTVSCKNVILTCSHWTIDGLDGEAETHCWILLATSTTDSCAQVYHDSATASRAMQISSLQISLHLPLTTKWHRTKKLTFSPRSYQFTYSLHSLMSHSLHFTSTSCAVLWCCCCCRLVIKAFIWIGDRVSVASLFTNGGVPTSQHTPSYAKYTQEGERGIKPLMMTTDDEFCLNTSQSSSPISL